MKIDSKLHDVESGGLLETKQFRIAANGFAFKALSDNLYKDKPGSIVRELASNAYDAHVAAGKPDTPFEIQLPTQLDPTFSLRDYGTGIPPDKMADVYCVMFDSTKRNTDTQIGGFGLGCKTPFSYAEQFSVDNFYAGKHFQYVCYMGEHGTPEISLLKTEDTNEPNGLRVSFGVKQQDFILFGAAVAKQLYFFKPRPKILGNKKFFENSGFHTSFEGVTPLASGPNWDVFTTPGRYQHHHQDGLIVVGQVNYPISGVVGKVSDAAAYSLSCGLIIRANIGDVSVTVSREQLSLDTKTIAYLDQVGKEIFETLGEEVLRKVNEAKTWREACTNLRALEDQLHDHVSVDGHTLRSPVTVFPKVWGPKQRTIGSYVKFTHKDEFYIKVFGHYDLGRKVYKMPTHISTEVNVYTNEKYIYVLIDTEDWAKRLRNAYVNKQLLNVDGVTVFQPVDAAKGPTLQELKDFFDGWEVRLASELPLPEKPKRQPSGERRKEVPFYEHLQWLDLHKERQAFRPFAEPPTKPGLYVPTFNKDPTLPGGETVSTNYLVLMYNTATKLGLVDNPGYIYGVTKPGWGRVKKEAGYQNFWDVVKAELRKKLDDKAFLENLAWLEQAARVKVETERSGFDVNRETLKELDGIFVSPAAKEFLTVLSKCYGAVASSQVNLENLKSLCVAVDIPLTIEDYSGRVTKAFSDFYAAYPPFKPLISYSSTTVERILAASKIFNGKL